ncbi:MFS transporter [Blastococcus haudaquaticus]|uniref:Major Facilitator Superfamily protein n=1 Tax=Blastococcus haudaquaticus TaxID=1938745 RepID=A0A286H831_9ACTN|nr:MFS transporter [Blastococcus haudaquaticus]SOE03424.1 Major Facilitator Superfamily protein [Blastococcus haudaquaticus]
MGPSAGSAQAGTRVGSVVAALCLVQFVDVLGVTVVVTALPEMLTDVGGTGADGTLVATGYAMFFGGLLMFGARLGDRLGHRRTILASLVVFAVGSLLAAVATSVVVLTAARCVQGAAAAAAVPSALKLLTTVADGDRARARAVAAWSAAGAAAGASGFVVGGAVSAVTTWRVIFWGLVIMAAVQAVAVAGLVPHDPEARARTPLNALGSVLLTAAVMLLVVGTTLLGEDGHRPLGALLAGAAVVVAVGFVRVDRRSSAPLLPVPLLRTPQVLRGTTGSFVNTATTSGVATLITLYLQSTLGRSPLEAAATLLPLSVAVIAGSAAAARLIVRRPRERVTAAGLALIGAGIALPLLAPAAAVLVAAGMAVAGFGLGLAAVATTSLGTDVDERQRATSSGVINTSAQLGTAIGTALVLLTAAATTGVPGPGTGTPVVAWAATAVLAGVAAALFARLPRAEGTRDSEDGGQR